jgi:hypothetical protein
MAGVGNLHADEGRLSETLLPDTTQGFAAITNVDVLSEHWDKTQLGHLMADPVMEPFSKDLHHQFNDRWSSVHDRLGVSLDDMKGVPGGDVGIGMIAPEPGKAALAIVVDVTGKLTEAKALLEKASENQLKRGSKRSEVKVEGCSSPVIQFDLPIPEESKEAARSVLKGSEKSELAKSELAKSKGSDKPAEERVPKQAFYCLVSHWLIVTDHLGVMKGILHRVDGGSEGSLAETKAFQMVRDRCKSDAPDSVPQIRWFVHPLGYAEVARAATPPEERRKGKSILEVLRNQGVGGILGAGGFVSFAAEDHEMVHRTAVYAPEPREKALKMLALLNEKDYSPQPWAPRDIATYVTLHADILQAFDNFGSLFDELFGEGAENVWNEVLAGLKDTSTGPGLDLRKDLFVHFGHRVTLLSDCELPITTSSERLLFAIEAADPEAVTAAMKMWMANDPSVKVRDVDGQIIWEMVEDESPEFEAPVISFSNGTDAGPQAIKKNKEETDDKSRPLMPRMAVTVWQGNLLIASHIDFLLKVIHPEKTPEPLSSDPDLVRIDDEIKKLGPNERCVQAFVHTDESYRATYELIRQNKMPESESMLARLLNGIFSGGKKGVARHQKIDGTQLPEFEVVRQYLGPAGFQATTEKDGWFLKGFTETKESKGSQGTK